MYVKPLPLPIRTPRACEIAQKTHTQNTEGATAICGRRPMGERDQLGRVLWCRYDENGLRVVGWALELVGSGESFADQGRGRDVSCISDCEFKKVGG